MPTLPHVTKLESWHEYKREVVRDMKFRKAKQLHSWHDACQFGDCRCIHLGSIFLAVQTMSIHELKITRVKALPCKDCLAGWVCICITWWRIYEERTGHNVCKLDKEIIIYLKFEVEWSELEESLGNMCVCATVSAVVCRQLFSPNDSWISWILSLPSLPHQVVWQLHTYKVSCTLSVYLITYDYVINTSQDG